MLADGFVKATLVPSAFGVDTVKDGTVEITVEYA